MRVGSHLAPIAMRCAERSQEGRRSRSRVTPVTVYAIAQLRFTDRAASGRYQVRFMDVFGQYRGTLLAADERPQVDEGRWGREKVGLMSFPDEAAFRAWSESSQYQDISKDREAGADSVVLLVKGLA